MNVSEKENEMASKYQVLAREVFMGYHQPVDFIPIMFDHGSSILPSTHIQYLKMLTPYSEHLYYQLQQAIN